MGLDAEGNWDEDRGASPHSPQAYVLGEPGDGEGYDEYDRESDEYSDDFREGTYRDGADHVHDGEEGMMMGSRGSLSDDDEGDDDDGEDFASGACDEDVCLFCPAVRAPPCMNIVRLLC